MYNGTLTDALASFLFVKRGDMADKKTTRIKKIKSKPETVRERAAKQNAKTAPRKRKMPGSNKLADSKSKVAEFLGQSVQTHTHSEQSRWSFITKSRHFVPAYFRNSWTELRNVTWPKLPEALRLTLAVILFASIFAIFISGLDWLLDKLFQELILNESQNIKEFLKGIF